MKKKQIRICFWSINNEIISLYNFRLSVTLSSVCDSLKIIWDMKLIFGIQYPDYMKMCWLTFGRSTPNIARVISLFMKIPLHFLRTRYLKNHLRYEVDI